MVLTSVYMSAEKAPSLPITGIDGEPLYYKGYGYQDEFNCEVKLGYRGDGALDYLLFLYKAQVVTKLRKFVYRHDTVDTATHGELRIRFTTQDAHDVTILRDWIAKLPTQPHWSY